MDKATRELVIEKKNYPEIWSHGLHECIPDDRGFDPAELFPRREVPLDVVNQWFDLGTARELRLYSFGKTFRVEFRVLCFDTDGNERWSNASSVYLEADSQEDAIEIVKTHGLYGEYCRRYSDDNYLHW